MIFIILFLFFFFENWREIYQQIKKAIIQIKCRDNSLDNRCMFRNRQAIGLKFRQKFEMPYNYLRSFNRAPKAIW